MNAIIAILAIVNFDLCTHSVSIDWDYDECFVFKVI
ncbi:hypothetical protein ZEAMMB73_Zm00001d012316 [Zea mays]|uniref:Uncharacterized protein n=2 Tax=Zea mays TaxID=4577 RepID=A0A1D6G853_MAIZE|nr:hypothetical protein ZEAMMB73_Zm00001d012316 [Zea mays]